jgi:hypothetical protein
VYVGVNAHFQLSVENEKGNGYKAARAIEDNWDASRALADSLVAQVVEVA